jgi:hypothetical protein
VRSLGRYFSTHGVADVVVVEVVDVMVNKIFCARDEKLWRYVLRAKCYAILTHDVLSLFSVIVYSPQRRSFATLNGKSKPTDVYGMLNTTQLNWWGARIPPLLDKRVDNTFQEVLYLKSLALRDKSTQEKVRQNSEHIFYIYIQP